MIHLLQAWDEVAFLAINGWGTPWLDPMMTLLSAKWPWIPVYIWLIWRAYRLWGTRRMWAWVVCAVLAIGASDFTASSILKPLVARYRPCQPEAGLSGPGLEKVYLVNGKCGGKFGFVSSHAANFFAIAFMASLLFRQNWKKATGFGLAVLVAWSRVYLGVHYPGDVLAGGLLGLGIAVVFWGITQVFFRKIFPVPDQAV